MTIGRTEWCLSLILAGAGCGLLWAQDGMPVGKELYARHCAECHGSQGEGVPTEYEDPLRGSRPLESLARYIDRYMPEENPEVLDAEQSKQVAEYMMGAFYSENSPASSHGTQNKAFARLTNRQFQESVADLIGSFDASGKPGEGRGLKGHYYQSDGMNKKAKLAFEREDGKIDFDFGPNAPGDGITPDQFSIGWVGSILPPATGWYDFRVSTPNGARLYINRSFWHGDGNHRDDSGGKVQQALIDAWVSSGPDLRHQEGRIFLLGGRAYPLRLDYFKFQEPRGMLRLEWKPPLGEWELLGAPFLSPASATEVTVVDAAFPPDDASEGYERGTGVSRDWLESITAASIQVANHVVARLPTLSGVQEGAPDRVDRLKSFVHELATRAFRRPLDDELRRTYVDSVFSEGVSPEQAVKRAVILILQSPRFLYPEFGKPADDYTVAARLALGAWDSLPDKPLLEAAAAGKLRTREQVAHHAERMMADARAKAKLHGFFERWLKLDVDADLQKDAARYPGFGSAIVADLRRSLRLFVEEVVWSEASDYRMLMEADYVYLNDRLARFYGAPVPEGGGFQKVTLDPGHRTGVVTHPYLLARLAHHKETSPILRGVFITRNVLGGILKPPPEAIAFQDGHFDQAMTTREKVVQMTSNHSCMTCHETINPLGFSLEHFDAVGRFRLSDNEKPVNPESDFEAFDGGTIRLRGPRDLANQAITTASARRGFVRQVFEGVIKQHPRSLGPGVLLWLEKSFVSSGYHIRRLLVDINTLNAFDAVAPQDSASP